MLAKTYANDGREWFILNCEPNRERVAAAHLVGRRFKAYLPTETKVRKYGVNTMFGAAIRERHTIEPIFRGMVFLRFGFRIDRERRRHLNGVPGIHSFRKVGSDYAILSDVDMDELVRIEYELANPPIKVFPVNVGDEARVSGGVAEGITGSFRGLDRGGRIGWIENKFGRFEVPADLIEAA